MATRAKIEAHRLWDLRERETDRDRELGEGLSKDVLEEAGLGPAPEEEQWKLTVVETNNNRYHVCPELF